MFRSSSLVNDGPLPGGTTPSTSSSLPRVRSDRLPERPCEPLEARLRDVMIVLAVEAFDVQRDAGVHRERLEPLAEQLGIHVAELRRGELEPRAPAEPPVAALAADDRRAELEMGKVVPDLTTREAKDLGVSEVINYLWDEGILSTRKTGRWTLVGSLAELESGELSPYAVADRIVAELGVQPRSPGQ